VTLMVESTWYREKLRQQRGQGKISERLMEYADPLLRRLLNAPTLPPESTLRSMLMIAVTLWNAEVLDQLGRDTGILVDVRAKIRGMPMTPDLRAVAEEMLERKRKHFPDDLRLIGDFDMSLDASGGLRVRAEARALPELMKAH